MLEFEPGLLSILAHLLRSYDQASSSPLHLLKIQSTLLTSLFEGMELVVMWDITEH